MSKFLKVLLITLGIIAVTAFAASTYTTHFNLEKPADGDENWGNSYRSNLDTIDTQMFVNETTIDDHITDAVGAHAATAISSAVGTTLCTSATTVQDFLECLDLNVGSVTGGTVMTTNTVQSVSATKTFNAVQNFASGLTISGGTFTTPFSAGVLHSDGSGVISSSNIVNADIDAAAAISDTKLDTISSAGKVSNSATTATSANTSGAIVARDGSGDFSANVGNFNTLKAIGSGGLGFQSNSGTAVATFGAGGGAQAVFSGALESLTSFIIQDPGAGTNAVTLIAPTLSGSYSLTFPTDDGSANQVLGTNGSGTLSWVDATSGYSSNSDTTLTASDTIAIGTSNAERLQHWRLQTSSGAVTMSTSPFGSGNPQDRTSICVVNIGTDAITFPVNDAADGIVSFGDVILDQWESACFRYLSTDDRFIVESRSN